MKSLRIISIFLALAIGGTSQAHASEFLTRLAVTAVVTVTAFAIDGAVGLVKDAAAGVAGMASKDGVAIPPAKDRPDPKPVQENKEEEKQ